GRRRPASWPARRACWRRSASGAAPPGPAETGTKIADARAIDNVRTAAGPRRPMDALLLARIQFGFTISFHILFPALTIGLASYLVVLEALWLRTGRAGYLTLYQFWLKPFAVAFAMGVVSGIVMAYQFGTNWAGFARFAGAITGPLLTYEVLTAFFLEAGLLGVTRFGLQRVGPGPHFPPTCVAALGPLMSATWILASHRSTQAPQGHDIVNGRAVPVDWVAVIFHP